MPVYSYQGKHYSLTETDPVAAKAKIMQHLGMQEDSTPKALSDRIPGNSYAPTPKEEPEASFGDKMLGLGESILSTGSSLTGGALGLASGFGQGVINSVSHGTFGTKEGVKEIEDEAARQADVLTMSPRTEKGKEYTEKVGNVLMQAMPAASLGHELGMVGSLAKGATKQIVAPLGKIKEAIIKDTPSPKVIDPEFEASRIKPEESVSDVITRKNSKTSPTTNEAAIEPVKASETPLHVDTIATEAEHNLNILRNPPENYSIKDSIEMKNWAEKQLVRTDAKKMEHEDARTLLRILRDTVDESIKNDLHPIVAEEHGITIKRNGNYIDEVRIPKEEQGKGLGTKIVENLEADIKREGHREAFLLAEPESVPFWEKMGYKKGTPTEGEPNLPMSKDLTKEKTLVAKKAPLARTDKDGNIHVNTEAATKDFENGFSYIFDGEGPTGAQKKAVFDQLGITREQFKEMVRTPEEYHTFLKAHEESHVRNGDHAKYPRNEDGSANLMHEDAISIEARATKDGLEAVQHESSLGEGIEIVKIAQRDIRTDLHKSEVFSNNLEKALKEIDPEGKLNHSITRALEGEKARDLLPENHPAQGLLKQVQARFKEIGERAKKAGLLTELRNNYVTHVLDFSKATISKESQQALLDRIMTAPKDSKLVKDFTEARKYEFLRELEKQLEGTGVVVHTDIVKILSAYEKAMNTAIAHKVMIDHFKTTLAPNGKAWLLPVSAEALKEKYIPFHGKGSKPLEGLLVHPDLKDVMGHVFQQTDPGMILRAMGAVSHLTKSLNTIGSFFHGYNLSIAHAMSSPSNFLKEVFTAGAGIRQAVRLFEHGGNDTVKIAGKDVPLVKLYDEFLRNGLVAGTEDIQRTVLAEAGVATDRLLSRFAPKGKELKLLQHVTNPLDKHLLQRLNRLTWDYMHTGQKLNLATHFYAEAKTKNPHIPDAVLQKEIVSRINTAFGGLDWLEVASQVEGKIAQELAIAATGIKGRTVSQVALFAPDWTVSTIRSATDALPRELYKPKNWELRKGFKGVYNPTTRGDFARRYMLNSTIAYMTILNGINYAFSGHFIWQNEDPARIELGDGTSMQPAKHSAEPVEWVHNPMKTMGNKLGFIPKATYIQFSGRAYPGEQAPKLKPMFDGYGGMEAAKAKAILLSSSPFQVSSGIQAPEGEGLKRAAMSALGMPIYGLTKEERAKAIAKGKTEAKRKREEARIKTMKGD